MSQPLDASADNSPPPQRPPSPTPAAARGCGLGGCLFAASLLLNVAVLTAAAVACLVYFGRSIEDDSYPETHVSGDKHAENKVAVVYVEGILMEGLLDYAHKQIEKAARDRKVKAVVLRVNSPGGSVAASADLHRRLLELRDGDADKGHAEKPIVVSMGSVAASGGYYVAVVGKKIYAEETTTTASIGVYAAFPNVEKLGKKNGFHVETIKAGEIKDAGSIFHELSPKQRQMLQDMVDEAYVQFLGVVEKGRPELTREKMLERFMVEPVNPDPKIRKAEPYERYRADGGTFSAPRAKKLGLVDEIGTLDDAVKAAAKLADLSSYKAVKYAKPHSLRDLLLSKTEPPAAAVDLERLEHALTPRLWHLAPGYEAAAFTAAARAAR